ncbi:PQQ-binding-like beta-propeller repeat protein [Streptomyces sp. TRM66268-LWL]|uniref:PQQ-binding-like beta-propeller repeat protein n=1 Tax=Streptomyces polyasparticus TaxID=2767826 RepID=A0ABR7S8F6_9ACTN|nr:serine/threonine-protein kinase [Streptomyces polyasparticus]MBC9711751.1 PQQ-binding-like beta-propeller repeat protein [Streptomyces polyasparticus]
MTPLGPGDPVRLGPYRLSGVLGEGGMGKVYVGQDAAGTLAAVKVLRPELAHDTDLAQRFVREAQAAQAVRSPGVAAVLGAWTEGGRPWIATEFLAGLTLDQAVDGFGPLDEAALRALAASLARTVADIHAAGFVHRDLKPQNIVLTASGPRIIDFGIARPEHGLTLTTTGQVPVTPGYGAPEQVLGQRVAPPADVFSLGAVFVYAATGRRAFDGGHVAAVQYAVVHGDPELAGLSPELTALVAPCLAKDAALRPTPAQIEQAMAPAKGTERHWRRGPLADAIKERERAAARLAQQGAVTASGQAPSPGRRRLLTGLAAAGAVVAATGGTGVWWLAGRGTGDDGARPPAKNDPFDIPPAARTPEQALEELGGRVSIGDPAPTLLWSLEDEADVYAPGLLPVRDVLVFAAGSGGIAAYDVRDGKRRWQAAGIRAQANFLSLSDRLVAAADEEGTLRTYVPSTGVAKWTCPAAEVQHLLAADDDAVYFLTRSKKLRSVGRSDAKVRWTASAPAAFKGQGAASAAAARGRLVIGTDEGGVVALDTRNGKVAWSHQGSRDAVVDTTVDGDKVFLSGTRLSARRLGDGKEIWQAGAENWKGEVQNWGPATVHAGSVYVGAGVYPRCLDARDGSEVWKGEWPANHGRPVLVQGSGAWYLRTVSEDMPGIEDKLMVSAVTVADGRIALHYDLPHAEQQSIAAGGNRVFAQSGGKVVALAVF